MKKDITILPSYEIEQTKWDNCVHKYPNGLVYAQYDYLDSICDHWSGLIIGDFEGIVALPWRKKYGLKYYYIPPFIQQLGFIGDTSYLSDPEELIKKIRSFAWYGDLHFNFSNHLLASALKCDNRTNFIIDLSIGYTAIHQSYSTDVRQTIQKQTNEELPYDKTDTFSTAIKYYQEQYADRMPHLSNEDFERLAILCKHFCNRNACIVRSIKDKEGHTLSNALLLKDTRRIYHLLNTTFKEGRTKHSNHRLMDQVLQEFSGNQLLFDFEGSDLPGVKSFYKKFGCHVQPYFHYQRNYLKGS